MRQHQRREVLDWLNLFELLSVRLPSAVNALLCSFGDSRFGAVPIALSVLPSSCRRRLSLSFVAAVTLGRSAQALCHAVVLAIEIVMIDANYTATCLDGHRITCDMMLTHTTF